ncbi:MAG: hypothetical protein IPG93_24425 [Burkholderiales bacterium]|nr:hypothetical protein [Burkholderiales bacterium]
MTHELHQIDATARLHDQARRRAEELRQEAMVDLWRDLDHALVSAANHAARSARRWEQRLQRHWRLRQAALVASADS